MRSLYCLIVAGFLGAVPARADVTYNFVTSSARGTQVPSNGFLNDGTGFAGFPLSLTFTDAGVAGGRVSGSLSASFGAAPQAIGLAGFVGLETFMDGATLTALYNSLSLDVTFDATGAVTTDAIDFSGTDLDISIRNGAAALGSDGLLSCTALIDSGACTATGSFVRVAAVPEPASLAIVSLPVIGLAAIRRRRRRLTR